MKQYAKVTPEGSRDLLFEECDDRRRVENALAAAIVASVVLEVVLLSSPVLSSVSACKK